MLLCSQGAGGFFSKETRELQRSYRPPSNWNSDMHRRPVFPFYNRQRAPLRGPQAPVTPQLQRET